MRARLLLVGLAASTLVPAPPARAVVPVLVVEGRGFGHGVGMAQDGAYWMARDGATANQILGHFYPGTALGRGSGDVRVAVFTGGGAGIAFPGGGEIHDSGDAPGFPVRFDPGGRLRLTMVDGRIIVHDVVGGTFSYPPPPPPPPAPAPGPAPAPPTTTTTVPPPSTVLPPTTTTTALAAAPKAAPKTATAAARSSAQPAPPPDTATASGSLRLLPYSDGTVAVLERQRRYRGIVDVLAAGPGFRLVNQLGVEQYLRGMGEVRDPRWPAAGLRVQAIAARTYALRAMAATGELCDTQRCQVYLGQGAEYAAMDKAVAATAGQVVVHRGRLASAVYSANGGGHSASREEGFGTSGGDYPYLRAAPYRTGDPAPWTVRVALADVARRFAYPGAVSAVEISRTGPSGRALEVALTGSAGRRTVTGLAFDAGLGLRSTMFSLRTELADAAPPPPPPGSILQAFPDELAAVAPTEDDPTLIAPADAGDTPSIALRSAERTDSGLDPWTAALELAAALALLLATRARGRWLRRPRYHTPPVQLQAETPKSKRNRARQ